jgi:hypothetical protein
VDQRAVGPELRQLLRLLDELGCLARATGAVDEPRLELAACRRDRLSGLPQVGDVVQGIVEAEDVDAVLGGRCDEPAHHVRIHRPRADEEPPAQRESERRLHPALERANPLPRALQATFDRAVEDPAAGHLEVREPGAVEDLRQPKQLRGRQVAGKWLLAEQADRRVGQLGHSGRQD